MSSKCGTLLHKLLFIYVNGKCVLYFLNVVNVHFLLIIKRSAKIKKKKQRLKALKYIFFCKR